MAQTSNTRVYTTDNPLIYEDSWDFWPYTFLNENGEPDGYNIDLLKLIFNEIDIPYVIRLKPFLEAQEDLKSGLSDLMFGIDVDSLHGTLSFGKSIVQQFTYSIAVPNDNIASIETGKDLSRYNVLVQQGSFCHYYIKENKWAKEIKPYEDMKEAVLDVNLANGDVAVLNTKSLEWLMRKYNYGNVTIVPIDFPNNEYKFVSKDYRLLEQIDSVYIRLLTAGKLQPIQSKWFTLDHKESGTYEWYLVIPALTVIVLCILIYYNRIRKRRMVINTDEGPNSQVQILNVSSEKQPAIDISFTKGTALKKGITLQCGKYTIIKSLGHGSFGITYLATTKLKMMGKLGQMDATVNVAIKEFFMSEMNSRENDGSTVRGSDGTLFANYRRKFRMEAENLSHLNHPNIVKVLEVFDENNTTYYVMQYIDGVNLDDYIMHNGSISETYAISILKSIGSALHYMHTHKMLHLDLKPKNIMLDNEGNCYLIDFGLSKQYTNGGEPESSTTIGAGTPGYAPLEQVNYKQDGSFPTTLDVYALGATFFKMLSGNKPQYASEVLEEGLDTISLKKRGVSNSTIIVLQKAMAPIKKNRYQTIKDFLSNLNMTISSNAKFESDDKKVFSSKACSNEETDIVTE